MKKIILLIFVIFIINDIYPCTIAIVSGRLTPDGRPLLWKNRDTDELNNKLMYFSGAKFDFIGLVNSPDKEGKEIWVGMNSAGFAIMNSVSYNIYLKNDVLDKDKDKEGIVMRLALESCVTVDDFEKLLNSLAKPMGVETNFGVIDAFGNGAFFETGHWHYKKYELKDAPDGYMLRTNFSYSGETDKGQGYERYLMEEQLFKDAHSKKNISVKFILQDAARCLKHGLTNIDLTKEYSENSNDIKFVPFMDFISRHSTSASVVIQGAKDENDTGNMIMWTILGFPPCSVSYPVWFNDEKVLPDLLKADSSGFAPLCNMALELKKKCFPVTRGRGTSYVNINALYNGAGTGIMQVLKPLDDEILSLKVPDSNPVSLYNNLDKKINESFEKLFQTK
ncbi:MAG: hypothetical protein JW917_01915 [Ignavibacteria bacterium]|nr:hypothetical protein [Ignavibacteria bacterium]